MNKTEFIKCVSQKSGVSQDIVRKVLNAMTGVIVTCMLQRDRLVLRGFGSFYTSVVTAHDHLHPDTGKQMSMLPQLRMRFKPSKSVLRALKRLSLKGDER